MLISYDEIHQALDILGLPSLITKEDIKKRYRFVAKSVHPDKEGGSNEAMERANWAYTILMQYIDNFRFTFDDEEIKKQFPHSSHAQRFKM
ncbi:MAG: J domain-containing protein [Campylobacterales bacterium]|nr:J domain-containing protein [Campylobacterales bacterium]